VAPLRKYAGSDTSLKVHQQQHLTESTPATTPAHSAFPTATPSFINTIYYPLSTPSLYQQHSFTTKKLFLIHEAFFLSINNNYATFELLLDTTISSTSLFLSEYLLTQDLLLPSISFCF
jgi:hypothetical protein